MEQRDNVLAIYTANHTSWVNSAILAKIIIQVSFQIAPEDFTHTKSRNLLQVAESDDKKDTGIPFSSKNVLLYITKAGSYVVDT